MGSLNKGILVSILLGVVILFACKTILIKAELEKFEQPTKEDGSLSFLVVGDWGRKGAYNQSLVANQMGRIGEKLDIDFVVSTGDNFYDNGLTGDDDTAFVDSFTNVYTSTSLQKPWYSVLGNHDYRGNAEAQLSPVLRKIDTRWICLRSFIVNTEIAELFFVDTTPMVDMYFLDTEEHTYDWRALSHSRKAYITNLLNDVDSALKESRAKWKIVVGHHAIRSVGHHGDTQELIDLLLPILRANDVDFYMNGHDHCLEQISDTQSPLQFITSGAGSKAWRGDVKGMNRELNFFYDGQGFISVELRETESEINFYDVFGSVLHRPTTSKELLRSLI